LEINSGGLIDIQRPGKILDIEDEFVGGADKHKRLDRLVDIEMSAGQERKKRSGERKTSYGLDQLLQTASYLIRNEACGQVIQDNGEEIGRAV